MSFTCNSCHKKCYGLSNNEIHFSGSYGPCESCGKVTNCSDCHGHGVSRDKQK